MSVHGYNDSIGVTWRDKTLTRDDLTVQQIADYIQEKRVVLSSTLWGRYKHRGRHHHLSFLQRIYATWLMVWTPAF